MYNPVKVTKITIASPDLNSNRTTTTSTHLSLLDQINLATLLDAATIIMTQDLIKKLKDNNNKKYYDMPTLHATTSNTKRVFY